MLAERTLAEAFNALPLHDHLGRFHAMPRAGLLKAEGVFDVVSFDFMDLLCRYSMSSMRFKCETDIRPLMGERQLERRKPLERLSSVRFNQGRNAAKAMLMRVASDSWVSTI